MEREPSKAQAMSEGSVLGLPVLLSSTVLLGGVLVVLGLGSVIFFGEPADEELDGVRAMLSLASVILPLATVVAYLTSGRIVNEIRSVVKGVDALAKGEVGRPIPVRTLDEIGELTRQFEALREHGTRRLSLAQSAKERAQRDDQFRTTALTSLSHELRTPLNAVLGFADVLLNDIDGPLSEAQREDVEVIRNAGRHLNDLFNDVIDISAAAGGDLPLNVEPVSLRSLLEMIVREERVKVDERKVSLECLLQQTTGEVLADPKRLRQVFGNLLSNAIKFTERGSIRVELVEAENGFCISVRDTGPGIAPRDQARVFGEFQQSGALPRRRAGSGLGLSIAKYLTERHGGSISLESTKGEGSVFYVRLPRSVEHG